jgi:hypothetical protein
VYSAEGQWVGHVAQVRAVDGQVIAVRAELSASAGLGGKLVDIPASKFQRRTNRVDLSLTTVEAARLLAIKP